MRHLLKTVCLALCFGAMAMLIGIPASLAAALPVQPAPAAPLAALPGFKAIFSGTRPDNLGVQDGQLAPCPSSPNCVVSQGADEAHAIAPLVYDGEPAAAIDRLATVVAAQPRNEIIQQTDDYLYAEFSSRLMGFVDDVEFYASPDTPGEIQVRAAARLGESDLGVNRDRIETIRADFQ
jgi:uncharacterized protein (DUF1499 family)